MYYTVGETACRLGVAASTLRYYDKEGLWNGIYDSFNVWGITGNAYFFNNTIIIDYKNKLFRIE